MKTPVEVRLPKDEDWLPAVLTDERSFGHAVVVLQGESQTRSPVEVFLIRATQDTDELLLEDARQAGYVISHQV